MRPRLAHAPYCLPSHRNAEPEPAYPFLVIVGVTCMCFFSSGDGSKRGLTSPDRVDEGMEGSMRFGCAASPVDRRRTVRTSEVTGRRAAPKIATLPVPLAGRLAEALTRGEGL